MSDETKRAAEICTAKGLCVGCPLWNTHGLKSFHECAAYAFRAYLAQREREEKVKAHIEAARVYFRQLSTFPEAISELDAAIKAIEEGRG